MVMLRTLVGWAAKPSYAVSFTTGSLVDYASAVTFLAAECSPSASPVSSSTPAYSCRSDALQLRELVSFSLATIGRSVNPTLQRRAMPAQIASLLQSHQRIPWISDEGIHLLGLRATIYRFAAPLDSLTNMVTHFAVLGYYNLALLEEWINRVQREASHLSVEQLLSIVLCVKRLHRFTSGLSDSQVNQILASLPLASLLLDGRHSPISPNNEGGNVDATLLLCKALVEIGTTFSSLLASWLNLALQGCAFSDNSPTRAELAAVPFAKRVAGSVQRATPDDSILIQVAEMAECLSSSEEHCSVARLLGVSMAIFVGRHFSVLTDTHWELLLRVNDALARPSLFSVDLQRSRRLIVLGFCQFLSLGQAPKLAGEKC